MRSVIYSMGVSLDGDIVGPDGDITAPPPGEEVWRLVTDEIGGDPGALVVHGLPRVVQHRQQRASLVPSRRGVSARHVQRVCCGVAVPSTQYGPVVAEEDF